MPPYRGCALSRDARCTTSPPACLINEGSNLTPPSLRATAHPTLPCATNVPHVQSALSATALHGWPRH